MAAVVDDQIVCVVPIPRLGCHGDGDWKPTTARCALDTIGWQVVAFKLTTGQWCTADGWVYETKKEAAMEACRWRSQHRRYLKQRAARRR